MPDIKKETEGEARAKQGRPEIVLTDLGINLMTGCSIGLARDPLNVSNHHSNSVMM
jgi:hypothetical protein